MENEKRYWRVTRRLYRIEEECNEAEALISATHAYDEDWRAFGDYQVEEITEEEARNERGY